MECLYIAKAAINKAIDVLEGDSTAGLDILNDIWSKGYEGLPQENNYIFRDIKVGNGSFTISYIYDGTNTESPTYFYGMCDEDRKININKANKELLTALFTIMEADSPESLANNIIYWRGDAPAGTLEPYYESLQIPYAARKAPFKTLEELSLVKGFRGNQNLLRECERFLTAYTSDNLMNINTASAQVLKAVFVSLGADNINAGLSDRLTNGVIDFRNGDDNEEATDDDMAIYQDQIKTIIQAGLVDILEINWVESQVFPFTVNSNLFRIDVWAELDNSKIHKKVSTIIDRNQQPLKVKYWHEE
jgi:hypothetical protein